MTSNSSLDLPGFCWGRAMGNDDLRSRNGVYKAEMVVYENIRQVDLTDLTSNKWVYQPETRHAVESWSYTVCIDRDCSHYYGGESRHEPMGCWHCSLGKPQNSYPPISDATTTFVRANQLPMRSLFWHAIPLFPRSSERSASQTWITPMTSNLPSDTRTIEVRPCPLPGSPGAQVAPIVGPLSKKEFMQAVRSCNWESLGIPGTAEPHFQNPRIFPISPSGRIFPFLFLRSPFLDFFIMIFHFFAWSAPFPWLVPCLFFGVCLKLRSPKSSQV